MNKFKENYENFERRKPKRRFFDNVDTTHIRFVDTATPDEIMQEYEFIKQKQSDLSAKERDIIIKMVENGQ